MARTKQTARKSTGGKAPRRQLAGSWRPINYTKSFIKRYAVSRELVANDPTDKLDVTSTAVQTTTSDAQRTVLSTPDLLILILSQLPHSTLLLSAKLVNKTWASVFTSVDIQAALFLRPAPAIPASYTEKFSDLLMARFWGFWSGREEDEEDEEEEEMEEDEEEPSDDEIDTEAVDVASSDSLSESGVSKTKAKQFQPRPWTEEDIEAGPNPHYRQLLVSQPAVEVLEIVQGVGRRGGSSLEFRTCIHRPGGLRMGFLFDAVKHWYKVEGNTHVEVLWNRKTGDPIESYYTYIGDLDHKMAMGHPCVTIVAGTSVGCGQYGGLTYNTYCARSSGGSMSRSSAQIIESGDEKVEYSMSRPRESSIDLNLMDAYYDAKRAK